MSLPERAALVDRLWQAYQTALRRGDERWDTDAGWDRRPAAACILHARGLPVDDAPAYRIIGVTS